MQGEGCRDTQALRRILHVRPIQDVPLPPVLWAFGNFKMPLAINSPQRAAKRELSLELRNLCTCRSAGPIEKVRIKAETMVRVG